MQYYQVSCKIRGCVYQEGQLGCFSRLTPCPAIPSSVAQGGALGPQRRYGRVRGHSELARALETLHGGGGTHRILGRRGRESGRSHFTEGETEAGDDMSHRIQNVGEARRGQGRGGEKKEGKKQEGREKQRERKERRGVEGWEEAGISSATKAHGVV